MTKTKKLVVSAILTAWIVILGMTQLGFISVGPIRATTLHIPVLVAAILYDKKMGLGMGLVFGFYSLITNYLRPTPLSFVFQNPVVSVLPRAIFPIIASYLYKILKDLSHKKLIIFGSTFYFLLSLSLAYSVKEAIVSSNKVGAVIGVILILFILYVWYMSIKKESLLAPGFLASTISTLLHTVMVMGLIYIIYLSKYMDAMNLTKAAATNAILMTCILNGVPEAVLGGVVIGALLKRRELYVHSN